MCRNYPLVATKNHDINAGRVLCTHSTFSKPGMVMVAVSKLGLANLISVNPGLTSMRVLSRRFAETGAAASNIALLETCSSSNKTKYQHISPVTQSSFRHNPYLGTRKRMREIEQQIWSLQIAFVSSFFPLIFCHGCVLFSERWHSLTVISCRVVLCVPVYER